MAQNRPCAVPGDEVVQFLFLQGQGAGEGCVGQFRHVLLWVIHPGGQVGVQTLQRRLDGGNALGQPSVQGGFCQRCPLPPVGRDDFHYGFGLGQRKFAVFQGAAGEFAGAGRGGAGQQQGFQQAVGHGRAAVDRKLDHILPGVGVGRPVKQRHRFVHLFTPQGVMAQHGGVAPGVRYPAPLAHRHKDFFHDGIGVGTRYPDHRNAALPRWRCQGADGLFQTVHR